MIVEAEIDTCVFANGAVDGGIASPKTTQDTSDAGADSMGGLSVNNAAER